MQVVSRYQSATGVRRCREGVIKSETIVKYGVFTIQEVSKGSRSISK